MLMHEAGYDPYTGNPYPTWRIKENLGRMIPDAIQAGHHWAQYLSDDAWLDGLGKHWSAWNREQSRISVNLAGREVRVPGSRGIRQRDERGKMVHQQLSWTQMSWEEVDEVDDGAAARITADGINRSTAAKVRELRAFAPDSRGPGEAAEKIGTTVEAWLMKENA